jgi:hypothetical protein
MAMFGVYLGFEGYKFKSYLISLAVRTIQCWALGWGHRMGQELFGIVYNLNPPVIKHGKLGNPHK